MSKLKTFTNPKFPNTSIDIVFDSVYGGGTIKQYVDEKPPQVMNMAKNGLTIFIDEIKRDGWS